MNTKTRIILILISLFFSSQKIEAATQYVGQTGSSGGNYFTNIQSAVDAAAGGDFVIVSNGTYLLSSHINVDKSLIIQSVDGPKNTIVDGNNSSRCFNLQNYTIVISGFTITNGNSGVSDFGGGVKCSGTTPVITNCVITGNATGLYGGGTYGGTINNCTISGNFAWSGGGTYGGTINNCTISGNSATAGGGAYSVTVNSSVISGNSVSDFGGGTVYSTNNNCTISGNTANIFGGGTYGGAVNNCIVWDNTAPKEPNYSNSTVRYSCSSPLPSGDGNISSDPEFIDEANDNYHLWFTSPCIDAGSTGYVQGETDRDGNPRIINGTVDMGSYEISRNYLISAPVIILPVSVLPGDTESFYTIDSQAVITGSKTSGRLVGLETEQGGIKTNGISQILSENSWQQNVALNKNVIIMSYYTCSSNISEVSVNKTTLEITHILLEIATNALIFPSEGANILAPSPTNITWDIDKITDDIDGTSVTISKISVYLAETTNEVATVTNDVSNLLGEIPWLVPGSLWGGDTNYVMRFEIVDSSSLTNSIIFWNNKFVIVPEPVGFLIFNLGFLIALKRRCAPLG